MDPALNMVSLVIISIMHVIGVVNSAFIVAVNILDWAKGQTLTTCDLILATIGILAASYQFTLVGYSYSSAIWWEVFTPGSKLSFLYLFSIWTGYSTNWLTTCLCVFFCVKIVDFNHAFFIWMKPRICNLMPWFLLGSVVGSLSLSVPIFCNLYGLSHHNSTTTIEFNSTSTDEDLNTMALHTTSSSLGFCLPLLLDIISIVLVLASLIRHTRRMKENASDFSQPRLESHFEAAKTMGALLFIYFLIFLTESCFLLSSSQWWFVMTGMIYIAQVPAQSTVLIIGNSKLKQTLGKIFSPCSK